MICTAKIAATNKQSPFAPTGFGGQETQKEKKESKMNPQQRTPCEKFSRAMGYIRPVSNFNIGKRAEYEERKTFTEANCLTTGARHAELMKKAA
jgi:hypothetical protein